MQAVAESIDGRRVIVQTTARGDRALELCRVVDLADGSRSPEFPLQSVLARPGNWRPVQSKRGAEAVSVLRQEKR
jgi:hypothetical protein